MTKREHLLAQIEATLGTQLYNRLVEVAATKDLTEAKEWGELSEKLTPLIHNVELEDVIDIEITFEFDDVQTITWEL